MDNFVEGDHGIQIVRPVKKGEEVLISYGNKSSCEMIGVYGFIEPVSEHSNIALHLPPPPSQAHKLLAGIVTPVKELARCVFVLFSTFCFQAWSEIVLERL